MVEIQCTSCHTRYRIDERVLPEETPTFKCSRCGHVFSADPTATVPQPKDAAPRTRAAIRKPLDGEKPKQPEQPVTDPSPEPRWAERPPAEPEDKKDAADVPAAGGDTSDSGENLSFDFSAEQPPDLGTDDAEEPDPEVEGKWRVGDVEDEAASHLAPKPQVPPDETRENLWRAEAAVSPPTRGFAAESEAPRYGADEPEPIVTVHRSAWFLGVFFAIAVTFGVASLLMCGSPEASVRLLSLTPGLRTHFERPITAAKLVALHDLRSSYCRIRGGERALVIAGNAQNVGPAALHQVLIAADLLDADQQSIGTEASWCGNGLVENTLGVMTAHEIQFLAKLEPQKDFAIAPGASIPFVLVFISPPSTNANFRISVAKAAASADTASARSSE
ncbi:MAG TPA: zinc-ribbon domain-containing protein [Candidatus Binataceae bacterium]|nr:zinc-ribbon domain-containing protein [Candidatus Binataceae bacterium]